MITVQQCSTELFLDCPLGNEKINMQFGMSSNFIFFSMKYIHFFVIKVVFMLGINMTLSLAEQ